MLVCTSKPQFYAQRIVEHFALARYFDGVYGAGLDASLDDKAKLMALLIERERLAAAQCAMIGDRAQDVLAARSNAVVALGALWGYGSRTELTTAGAYRLLATPAEIPASLVGL
jgi:phosphoglycolate phosphatase